jgi:hypothetical protein
VGEEEEEEKKYHAKARIPDCLQFNIFVSATEQE